MLPARRLPRAGGRSPCGERGLKCVGRCRRSPDGGSLPVRGAWVEMRSKSILLARLPGRSPCGERGLKLDKLPHQLHSILWSLPVRGAWVEIYCPAACRSADGSLPVRGAWVEISTHRKSSPWFEGRSPCGERGLKSAVRRRMLSAGGRRSPCGERGLKSTVRAACCPPMGCRSPCGERGLKLAVRAVGCLPMGCRSPCGERGLKFVWLGALNAITMSLPVRGAWVEIRFYKRNVAYTMSLPVRGAWVEIRTCAGEKSQKASRSPCGERGLK